MDSPSDLVDLLLSRPATLGEGRLLCLDGPAGSGKTTLAAAVAALVPAHVVHMDELYDGWTGLPHVGEQLDTLLLPLTRGVSGSYRRYDWSQGRYADTVTVEPTPLLVVEGVGSGLAAYASLRTLLVWIEAAPGVRLARWRARDGDAAAPYLEQWIRAEQALFDRNRTRESADLIVDTGP